jgi:hypothetical protein
MRSPQRRGFLRAAAVVGRSDVAAPRLKQPQRSRDRSAPEGAARRLWARRPVCHGRGSERGRQPAVRIGPGRRPLSRGKRQRASAMIRLLALLSSSRQLEVRAHFRFHASRRLVVSDDRRPGKQATDCRLPWRSVVRSARRGARSQFPEQWSAPGRVATCGLTGALFVGVRALAGRASGRRLHRDSFASPDGIQERAAGGRRCRSSGALLDHPGDSEYGGCWTVA